MRWIAASAVVAAALAMTGSAGSTVRTAIIDRTLDGSVNNPLHPAWGKAGTQYLRVAPANYTDGTGQMVAGPSPRYVSNRIFNDVGQNLFSENGISQWGWAWGQFIDHDVGLRDESPGEDASMPFAAADPLEEFQNDLGALGFARTPAAPGTGVTTTRQEINTISSYIDASQIYGVTASRLDWLRNGSADGNPENNQATLMLPNDYLPFANARGNAATAPLMDLFGNQVGNPASAVVAGDVRANENFALTAIQTLFAREHNRVVSLLPAFLPQELKFQLARHVVGAEIQYVTYNEFLPTLGVQLAPYKGYKVNVNASLGNEFAAVGFRGHSMVHGEFEPTAPAGTFTDGQLARFEAEGITVEESGGDVTLVIPLNVAFGNPALLQEIGLGPVLGSLGEHEYRNDEQIDNSLRSVLFQVPKPGIPDPTVCGEPLVNPDCFADVADLGADDIQRGSDHGMPAYNQLRSAYGLPPVTSFTQITGESTDAFPGDPLIDSSDPIDDPNILDFVELRDEDGNVVPLGSPDAQEDAVVGVRRTTLAARLKAIYGSVDNLDAFVGMVSEKHVAGTEFGPLQLAIWKKQFETLRNGDRFFYKTDLELPVIKALFGIDYRNTLAEIVQLNTGVTINANAFKAA